MELFNYELKKKIQIHPDITYRNANFYNIGEGHGNKIAQMKHTLQENAITTHKKF